MKNTNLVIAIALAAVLLLTSCGGGGGGGGTTPPPPPPPPPPAMLQIVVDAVPDGMIGEPYSVQLTTKGGSGTIAWSISAGSASWASVDPTGKVSGTPPTAGQHTIAVRAQDSATTPHEALAYLYVFVSSPMQITTSPDDAIRGYPYYWGTRVTGGKPPFTASVLSGTMPLGLTASTSGDLITLTGAPADLGSFSFTLRIKDSASSVQTLDQTLTLKVQNVLKITSQNLKGGLVGRLYSDAVAFVNGTPPLHWGAVNLGQGLSIDPSTGSISGTPTEQGNAFFSVTVTDSSSPPQTDSKWLNLSIFDVLHVDTPIFSATGNVNQFMSVNLRPSGGMPPVEAVIASGSVPPGMTYEWGSLRGTPTTAGTWNFGLYFSDSAVPPQTYDQPVVITILPPLPEIVNYPSSPVIGEPYRYEMKAIKGTPPFHWSVANGNLPGGITFSDGGVLSGTAVASGRYFATLRATDSANPSQRADQPVVLTILPKPLGRNDTIPNATAVSVFTTSLANLSPYEDPPGMAAPDTDYYKLFALAGSQVMINIDKGGSVHTDPVLEIVDANGIQFSTCRDLGDDSPSAPIIQDTTPTAFDDKCINDDVDLGVNLNSRLEFQVPGSTGQITTFFAHVLDNQGNARPDMPYWMTVNGALTPFTIISDPNLLFVKGTATNLQLQTSGGKSPVTWSLDSGTLPPGLSLTAGGVLSGTPSSTGQSTFRLIAKDSSTPPITDSRTFGITVTEPLKLNSTSFPAGQTGVAYSAPLLWSGGTSPYTLSASGLPQGLNFDMNTGVISGVPQVAGTSSVWVTVRDWNGAIVSSNLNLIITNGPLYISTTLLPNATKNAIYSALVKGAGGKQPFSWQLMSGALPPGMSLNASTGEIRGIPTSTGVFSFTVKLTDANAASSTATLQLTVQ
jgi:hypothetical protein